MQFNQKFKLLGFNRSPSLSAKIMVLSTGKTIAIGLHELESSEIFDDLNNHEKKALYKKLYGGQHVETIYDMSDRNERSWNAYILISLTLAIVFICSNLSGIKPVEITSLNMNIPAAIFIYPVSFILVDMLNEFYGLKMARRTIFISLMANIIVLSILWATTQLPTLNSWPLSDAYDSMVGSILSVLVASSIAYIISENINSYLLCKIKAMTQSRHLYLRVITSTAVASLIDSVLFIGIAFYGTLSRDIMYHMMVSQFIIKLIYAVLGILPIYGVRWVFSKYINEKRGKQDE